MKFGCLSGAAVGALLVHASVATAASPAAPAEPATPPKPAAPVAAASPATGAPPPPLVVEGPPVIVSTPSPAPKPPSPPTAEEETDLVRTAAAGRDIAYYHDCDGYGAPAASGDGMTRNALRFWSVGGNTSRGTPAFGRTGLGACGAALQDLDARYAGFWMRKVSLLRARALHRLALADPAGALRDLDAADAAGAAGADDPLYRRSLALGTAFVRAYAVRRSGDAGKGRAMALEAWATRPWNRETSRAARAALGPGADLADLERVLRSEVMFNPIAAAQLFSQEFERGLYADALELVDGLTPPVQLSQGSTRERDVAWLEQSNRADAAAFWAEVDGRRAYALAALGRFDEARAALKAADERYAGATPPAKPLAADASNHDRVLNAVWEQANLKITTEVPPILAAWRAIVGARIDVAEGRAQGAADYLKTAKPPSPGALIELYTALGAKDPDARDRAERLRKAVEARRSLSPAAEVRALFEALPEAETRGRVVGDQKSHPVWGSANGFTVTPHPDAGTTTVSYRGISSSLSLMEESALLKAAKLAQEGGKTGMVVLARRDIRHTLTTYTYGVGTTTPSGFETQLDVVFVDPAAPPPPWDKLRWRVIDVKAVRSALEPVLFGGEGTGG